ncbi:MAG: NADP-dependent oxidoreductase [Mycetocola sp.]
MSRAVTYAAYGGPEVLTVTDIDTPLPGPGEVAVRVEAAGVNPADWKVRSGARATSPLALPQRIGSDGAGIVTAIGDGIEGLRIGNPVVVFGASGVYASDVVVPFASIQHRPPQVGAQEGAALGIPVGTAYQTLRSLGVGAGDTLLVHAGSGAVGQAVIQFAVLWGVRVVATSSPRRFERIRGLGAMPVAYGEGLADRLRDVAPSGISVAIDAAGTDEAIEASLAVVPNRSHIATLVRGADASRFGIRAFGAGSPLALTPQQRAWRAEGIPVALALLAAGRFSLELGPTYSLDQAGEAHRVVQAGIDGKVVLTP